MRKDYLKQAINEGRTEEVLRNLLLHNSTGFTQHVDGDQGVPTDVRLISCVTLGDLLGPFEKVDFIEADMQESEIRAFPPFIDLLRRKVRRIHIATHGQKTHDELHALFASHRWDIVFNYGPDATHETPLGSCVTNDGLLTVVNPDL